jgi:hypothetical protein
MKYIGGYSAFVVLCVSVFFLPLWFQVVLFIVSLILLKKKYLLLIPAIISDILYMPQGVSFFPKTVVIVLVILLSIEILRKTTRFSI